MPLPDKKRYTIDDIYELPDGERAELIDGKMYMTRRDRGFGSVSVFRFCQIRYF